jgi:hypothetical protein
MVPRRRPVAEPWNIRPSRSSVGEGDLPSRSLKITSHLCTASLGDEGVIEEACYDQRRQFQDVGLC